MAVNDNDRRAGNFGFLRHGDNNLDATLWRAIQFHFVKQISSFVLARCFDRIQRCGGGVCIQLIDLKEFEKRSSKTLLPFDRVGTRSRSVLHHPEGNFRCSFRDDCKIIAFARSEIA